MTKLNYDDSFSLLSVECSIIEKKKLSIEIYRIMFILLMAT